LYRGLRRRKVYEPQPGWGAFWLKLAIALLVMGAVLWFGSGPQQHWLEIHGLARGLRLAAVIAAGVVAYFATLFALGFRLRDFRRRGAE
ncbi:MAG: lipid II flippase MurJ, partial [Proteobacteria bacterium]|nr:lipid II flippase MurJ [Pseudomonadota bacterium]